VSSDARGGARYRPRMITVRRAEDRGHTRLPWLDSRHTFSFDRYGSTSPEPTTAC